jgi:hypothetical protein
VRGADGHKVGRIIHALPGYVTIEAGLMFKRDTFVPNEEVARVTGGEVMLREPAHYYRGGDLDDGRWNAEIAERARRVDPDPRVPQELGLPSRQEVEAEQLDERAPSHGEPVGGVHVPRDRHPTD